MRLEKNLARIKDVRNESKTLFGTPERKRPVAATARIWKVQLKTDLQKAVLYYRLVA